MADTDQATKTIRVEVAFALPDRQEIVALQVHEGSTAEEAIALSSIQDLFPSVALSELARGIFGRPLNGRELPLPDDYILQENDRVEIYRALENDPKQARMDRVKKARQERNR